MSEFSHSVHVRGRASDEVAAAMRRGGVAGAVLPKTGPYVTALVDPEDVELLVRAVGGIVLGYQYGSDHGLWIVVCRDGEEVTRLAHVWDDMAIEEGDGTCFDGDAWRELDLLTEEQVHAVQEALEGGPPSLLEPHPVALLLGLTDFQWMSVESLAEGDFVERTGATLVAPEDV